MNIAFTPPIISASAQIEASRAERTNAPSTSEATVKGNEAERSSPNKSTESLGETHKPKPAEPGAKAHQEALNDPSSQLFKELQALKNRDREVRAHEQTHLAAAGPYALGGPTYQFQRGPDGQRYAVGGHVNIDTSAVAGDPEATLRKAETIQRAALAPAEPSSQDRRVAAQASSLAISAQQELAQLRQEEAEQTRAETQEDSDETPGATNATDKSREKLEEDIRQTGALGSTTPQLDIVA